MQQKQCNNALENLPETVQAIDERTTQIISMCESNGNQLNSFTSTVNKKLKAITELITRTRDSSRIITKTFQRKTDRNYSSGASKIDPRNRKSFDKNQDEGMVFM